MATARNKKQDDKNVFERRPLPPKTNPVPPDHDAARSAEILLATADFLATLCLDSQPGGRQSVTLPTQTAWRLAEVLLGVGHHLLDAHEEETYPPKVRALGRQLVEKFAKMDTYTERAA